MQALVLSHNAPASLQRCPDAHRVANENLPRPSLVIDNASDTSVDLTNVDCGITLRIVHLETNLGPAGGWANGLQNFEDDPTTLPGSGAISLD